MIRLIHQFDPAHGQASAASPKSSGGSCCSCCCCIVTTLITGVVTARSIRRPTKPLAPVFTKGQAPAPAAGSATTATLPAATDKLWRWKLVGFSLLLLPFATGFGLDYLYGTFPAISVAALLVWLGGLVYLVVKQQLKWYAALGIVMLAAVISLIEMFASFLIVMEEGMIPFEEFLWNLK